MNKNLKKIIEKARIYGLIVAVIATQTLPVAPLIKPLKVSAAELDTYIQNLEVTDGRVITNTDIIASSDMKVTIDKDFPNVVQYEKGTSIMYGTEKSSDKVLINGKEYIPEVAYNNSGEYTLIINEINVVIKAKFTVDKNVFTKEITEVQENGSDKVSTIEFANQNLLSVRSTQAGAKFAGSRMHNAVSGTGDIFETVTENSTISKTPTNYLYGMLNTNELSGAIWTNSYSDYSKDNDNERIKKQTTYTGDFIQTSLWSSSWVYRAEDMPVTVGEDTVMNEMPVAKVIITGDANNDKSVDWQDGAVAFRDIMNVPFGSEDVPDLVVMRIPFNFASTATNPFLKTLDETKKMYLATDGLKQWVELKGYQAEGHDQAHLDYGGHIGVRQGGAEDLNTLVEEGHKYGGYFGVHISATGANPEANNFSEDVADFNKKGWDWLDPSYDINKEQMRREASENNRLERLQALKDEVPNLDFIYADAFFEQGFNARRFANEINSLGWNLTTEFPYVLENDSTFYHWSVDYKYGGKDMKGYNSDIARFIRNHQKDAWIAKDPLLGGTEMEDYEGWLGRTNFDNTVKMTFETNLPTKYMQHFPIVKMTDDTINFEDNVTVSNETGKRIMTKDDITILNDESYLLPWDPKEETKLYHWNSNGGTTNWKLPNSWSELSTVKLYKLTDTGRVEAGDLVVNNNEIIINAEANVAYTVEKGEVAPIKDINWGEGGLVKDPSFESSTLDSWNTDGTDMSILRNDRGQYELKTTGDNASMVSQELTGLSAGTYEASVNVEVAGDRKATIGVKDYGNEEVSNYADKSFALNYIAADSKNGTNMQRMSVLFDIPEGQDSATLYLGLNDGTGVVTLDEVRVTKTSRSTNPNNAYFTEDFEAVQQGWGPFIKAKAGGINDPRTHLSELNAPYTQKGWHEKTIDDVINGEFSLKAHKEATGLVYQTIPQTLRFMPGRNYRVSFKYQNDVKGGYGFVIGQGKKQVSTQTFDFADESKDYTVEFTAPESGDLWIGVMGLGGGVDLVIDDIVVEDIGSGTDNYIPIPKGDIELEDIDQSGDISLIPQSGMKITASSEETSGEWAPASNAIDGDNETFWHSNWSSSQEPTLPHSITLDLGEDYDINKVTVVPRQGQDNGVITKYEIHTSIGGENYTKITEGKWEAGSGLKTSRFESTKAKYVKLVVVEGKNGFATIGEINVGKVVLDKSNLSETIEKANILVNNSVVGKGAGQCPQLAKNIFLNEILKAQAVLDNSKATQEEVDEAVKALDLAVITFKDSFIVIISKAKKLKITNTTNDSITLSWSQPDNTFGLVEYVIYKDGKQIAIVPAETLSYEVDNLKKNTRYRLKVTAKYSKNIESKPVSVNGRTIK